MRGAQEPKAGGRSGGTPPVNQYLALRDHHWPVSRSEPEEGPSRETAMSAH